jgi:hypothetical protein
VTKQIVGLALALFAWATLVSVLSLSYPGRQDEAAHVSYAVHLAEGNRLLPDFAAFPMYDAMSRQWGVKKPYLPYVPAFHLNYLNHPPGYYLLLAPAADLLSPVSTGDIYVLRLINGLVVMGGLALALSIVLRERQWSWSAQVSYVVVLITVPALLPMAAEVTNESLAFLGGCLAAFGAHRLLKPLADVPDPMLGRATGGTSVAPVGGPTGGAVGGRGVVAMFAGTALAFAATPIAGAQVGLLSLGVAAAALRSPEVGRPPLRPVLLGVGLLALSLIPYAVFAARYGSPVPVTPGMLEIRAASDLGTAGNAEDTLDIVDRVVFGVLGYPLQWPISKWNNILLLVPLVIVFGATLAGVLRSTGAVMRGGGGTSDRIVIAGSLAFVIVIGCGIAGLVFTDAFESMRGVIHPRTYFPLLPAMAMALAIAVNGVARRPRRQLLAGVVVISCALLFGPIYALVNEALAAG